MSFLGAVFKKVTLPKISYIKKGEGAISKLTKKQRRQIVADYVLLGSYRKVADKYGISHVAVGNIVLENKELYDRLTLFREENIDDLKEEIKKFDDVILTIFKLGLFALADPEKINNAPVNHVVQMLGTIKDKFIDDKQAVKFDGSGVVILPQQAVLQPDDDVGQSE